MSRSVKEIIEYCRETKEEMSLSDFKTCINAIYFHIGQAVVKQPFENRRQHMCGNLGLLS